MIIGDVTTDLTKEEDTAGGECDKEELLSNVYNEMQDVRFVNVSSGELELKEQQGINIVPDADAQDEAAAVLSDNEVEEETAANDNVEQIHLGKKRKKIQVSKVPMSSLQPPTHTRRAI